MSGRRRPPGPSDLTDRLRQHLDVIGLTYTLEHLDEHLAWATQEKPAADALLDHVLGAEAAYKLERRIQRRIDQSGLPERKTLEAFDFPFQPKLDKALVFSSNIKLSAWGKYLGDATLAVAILDRVAMRAIRLDIDGPSYRQQVARDRAEQRGATLPDDSEQP